MSKGSKNGNKYLDKGQINLRVLKDKDARTFQWSNSGCVCHTVPLFPLNHLKHERHLNMEAEEKMNRSDLRRERSIERLLASCMMDHSNDDWYEEEQISYVVSRGSIDLHPLQEIKK